MRREYARHRSRGGIFWGRTYVQEAQKRSKNWDTRWAGISSATCSPTRARVAVRLFEWVHSVDSLRLAEELNRAAQQESRILPVLLQVNLGQEATKFGAQEDEVFRLLEKMAPLPGISVKGLMTMPPYFEKPGRIPPLLPGSPETAGGHFQAENPRDPHGRIIHGNVQRL